jgi:hypothetical protein
MLEVVEKQNKQLNTLRTQAEPRNWEITISKDKYYTSDEVIDAYLHGKKTGLESLQKVVLNTLSDNINKTGNYTTEIIEYYEKEGFNPKATFLKILSWDNYKILITIPEKEYLSDKFLQIYEYISKFEEKINNELYRLEISFVETNGLDINCVQSDGFILKHTSSKS